MNNKSAPSRDELAEVVMRYTRARADADQVNATRKQDRPADPMAAIDELFNAETSLLYAGRLLIRFEPEPQPKLI